MMKDPMDNPAEDDDEEGGTSTVPTEAAADEARQPPSESKMPPPFSMEVPKPSRKAADRKSSKDSAIEDDTPKAKGLMSGKGKWGKAINKVLIAESLKGGGKKKNKLQRPKIGVSPRVFWLGRLSS